MSATHIKLSELIAMQHQAASWAVRRKYIRAAMSGAHVSRLRGRGMEFDEVRVYQPGDDVGSIDWKVTARKGVTHVKLYREERERPVLVCLDYRNSMFFATQGALKSVVATQAAALLAWHGIGHGDRLGGMIFSGESHAEIKPMRGKRGVLALLHQCSQHPAWQHRTQTAIQAALDALTRKLRYTSKHGSLIYILSDFRGLNKQAIADLVQLARHNDVVLISVVDPLEQSFPKSGTYPVFDGKQYFQIQATPQLRQQWQASFEAHQAKLDELQTQYGITHITLHTDDAIADTLAQRLRLR
ncbi:DUF58 domain-containing protein [Ghiorsea bivora]|uniref:DUF58 domain-containing protein n=1 Tax=Ghiorsea bivora TaxID=1485545 RepID=UPI00056F78D0|nr:DUF58 domain-containing protein [Ghiorsea bivora]